MFLCNIQFKIYNSYKYHYKINRSRKVTCISDYIKEATVLNNQISLLQFFFFIKFLTRFLSWVLSFWVFVEFLGVQMYVTLCLCVFFFGFFFLDGCFVICQFVCFSHFSCFILLFVTCVLFLKESQRECRYGW